MVKTSASAEFVRELSDGTKLYDVVLVDAERGVDVELRIGLFNDEPIICENHATREATVKTAAVARPKLITLIARPSIERARDN